MQDGTRLTDEQAGELLPLVRGKVRKFLSGTLRHAETRQDLVQATFVRLLERLPLFDPVRGSLGDFAATVVDSVLVDHVRHQQAAKRDCRRDRVSLNAPIRDADGELTELAQVIAAKDHESSYGRHRLRESEMLDLLLDLSEALHRLAPAQRQFLERLKTDSVADVAEQDGVHRGTGYRRLRSVRKHLQNDALREYLE